MHDPRAARAGSPSQSTCTADSGRVHTVTTTPANEADIEQIADLLHGKEQHVWADPGLQRLELHAQLVWHDCYLP